MPQKHSWRLVRAILVSAAFVLVVLADGDASPVAAQGAGGAGPLIAAEEERSEDGFVALRPLPTIIGFPTDAEVIFVAGYKASSGNAGNSTVTLHLDRPGSTIVLVLSSYERVVWDLRTTLGTTVAQVLIGGYHESALKYDRPVRAYRADIPSAYEIGNARFERALSRLWDIYGIDSIDFHLGQYGLPDTLTVRDLGDVDPRLARSWPPVEAPVTPLELTLTLPDFSPVLWSPSGPVDGIERQVLAPEAVALSPDGRTAYQVGDDAIMITDIVIGRQYEVPIPPNFESFSFFEGIAYDIDNDVVAIVTSDGGGGAFYRFDAVAERWRDFRRLNRICGGRLCGMHSLSYDAVNHTYLAAGQFNPGLIVLSQEGEFLEIVGLGDVLPGIMRTYDSGNGPAPSLSLVPQGQSIAILLVTKPDHFARPNQPRSVRRIWLYDRDTNTAQLTYERD